MKYNREAYWDFGEFRDLTRVHSDLVPRLQNSGLS